MQADGLILAGGKSTRMGGRHKGDLIFREQTFLERIIEELKMEAETVWISYGTLIRREYPGCQIVQDEYPDCGPIGGFHAGFKKSRNGLILTAACDMPFLKIQLYHHLYEMLERAEKMRGRTYAGVVPVTDRRPHPLTAIYRKDLAGSLEQQIQKGDYRLQAWLQSQDMFYVDLTGQPRYKKMLRNVNSLAEYEALLLYGDPDGAKEAPYPSARAFRREPEKESTADRRPDRKKGAGDRTDRPLGGEQDRPLGGEQDWPLGGEQGDGAGDRMDRISESGQKSKDIGDGGQDPGQTDKERKRQQVIAVCGIKNSGKTTLLVRLVKALTERGFKVAVIKHDGHDFTCDIPGTDSYRFWEAGACGTAVYSGTQTFIHRAGRTEEDKLLEQFPEADILFIEGQKESHHPKIEVIRRAAGGTGLPVSNRKGRFLLVTDWEPCYFDEPVVGFEDLEEIILRILMVAEMSPGMQERFL